MGNDFMKKFGTFSRYMPELPADHPFITLKVMFFKNAAGEDWYDLTKGTLAADTTFVAVNDENVVILASNDMSRIVPDGLTVYGVSLVEDPSKLVHQIMSAKGKFKDAPIPAGEMLPITEVSKVQAKLALLDLGQLDDVEAFVAGADRALSIWYADTQTWKRDAAQVEQIATGIKEKADWIDSFFALAATK